MVQVRFASDSSLSACSKRQVKTFVHMTLKGRACMAGPSSIVDLIGCSPWQSKHFSAGICCFVCAMLGSKAAPSGREHVRSTDWVIGSLCHPTWQCSCLSTATVLHQMHQAAIKSHTELKQCLGCGGVTPSKVWEHSVLRKPGSLAAIWNIKFGQCVYWSCDGARITPKKSRATVMGPAHEHIGAIRRAVALTVHVLGNFDGPSGFYSG